MTKPKTDPYGALEYAVGSEDDFWCFDFAVGKHTVTLHAVINSETGAFIMDAEPPITVPLADAVGAAMRLVRQALDWCSANDVEVEERSWNQDPAYFVRVVRSAVSGSVARVPRHRKKWYTDMEQIESSGAAR